MTDDETKALLKAILHELTEHMIPLEVDLWDTEHIARYLKRSYSTVRDKILPLSSFPKAIRIRTANGTGHPLYKAREVIQWAESLQEK
ncbi:hypothetical protein ACEN88_00495 [Massilia sp. CT11-108]|uniref:hypothetical protein n=1 Tax=Massilia sp. CT11-108 TaxID=3393900 RepID=UPI0039A4AD6A